MHFNERELVTIALKKAATIEGIMKYKVLHDENCKAVFKEFWFKLINNFLFCFGLNYFGGIRAQEPLSIMVLENCTVSFIKEEDPNNFSITFSGNQERHSFSCLNLNQAQSWVVTLRQASYEHLRVQAKILEDRISSLGGKRASGRYTTSSKASIRRLRYPIPATLSTHPDSQRNLNFASATKFKLPGIGMTSPDRPLPRPWNDLSSTSLVPRTQIGLSRGYVINDSQLPELENKASALLSLKENDEISKLIGLHCKSMASAVVQVYFADPPSKSQWNKRHCGVLCFIKDNIKRSYYLRVFCLDRQLVVWEQELYSSFEYCAPRPYFHTFEGDDCRVGLNFANDTEAEFFLMTMKENRRIKPEKRVRRRLPHQRPMNNKSIKDKNKKITKADIGLPSDFKHISHVGWDPNQAYDNVDPNLLKFFARAGISESHLKDQATREYIYDFIDKHGGKEAAIRETSRIRRILFAVPSVPARNPPSMPQSARMAPPSRLTAAPSPIHSRIIAFPQSTAPPAPSQLTALSKMAPVTTTSPPPSPAGSPPALPPSLNNSFPSIRSLVAPSTSAAHADSVGSALMNDVKEEAEFKSFPTGADHSIKMDLKSPITPDLRSGLLIQIRAGKRLKPVKKDVNHLPVIDDVTELMAGALARALEERCRVIHSESDDSGQDQDDDDWND